MRAGSRPVTSNENARPDAPNRKRASLGVTPPLLVARRGARFRFLCQIGGAGHFHTLAKMAILLKMNREWRMKALSAKDAKYNFGRMIDLARAEPVVIEKHGRPVVVVMAVEEYERLTSKDISERSGERT